MKNSETFSDASSSEEASRVIPRQKGTKPMSNQEIANRIINLLSISKLSPEQEQELFDLYDMAGVEIY